MMLRLELGLRALLATATALPLATATPSTSLNVEAAYHVIYSYEGASPPSTLLQLVKEGLVGGVILFGDNVANNISEIVESFQNTYKQSPYYAGSPLLIMTDQEGGQVRRLPGGPDLSEKDIGLSSDPNQAATQAGKQASQALAAAGNNANLAPVLDVFRQPGDFIDEFQRSYSNDSTVAGECGAAFIAEQQSLGVLAAAKHFPGLGAALAGENTDEKPVTINLTLSELQSVDEAAYVDAIKNDVAMIMTSWALYPALDEDYPSGLSSKWIQDELRGRLGYQGVTISDAIEAGGLEGFGDDETRAVLASKAGLDIILAAARDYTQGQGIVSALADAVDNGTLSQDAFSASTQRILDLRKGLNQ